MLERRPALVDIDNDGDLDLFVGGEAFGVDNLEYDPNLSFYRNNGSTDSLDLVLENSTFAQIAGRVASGDSYPNPTIADIDGDGDYDLFLAGDSNLDFFQNTGSTIEPNLTFSSTWVLSLTMGDQPTLADIDADGDLDLFLYSYGKGISFFRNIGTRSAPIFSLDNIASLDSIDFKKPNPYNPTDPNDLTRTGWPIFADIDNDNDLDLVVGDELLFDHNTNTGFGSVYLHRNVGTSSVPNFDKNSISLIPLMNLNRGSNSTSNMLAPEFVDIDSDGDLDLFVGEVWGFVSFFKNTGTATNFTFTLESTNYTSKPTSPWSGCDPTFADIDNDGDLDLFLGRIKGNIELYRNSGTATVPNFVFETSRFALIDRGENPTFVDIDDDGDLDLFSGNNPLSGGASAVYFYRNLSINTGVSISETTGPNTYILDQNYPNPFNPETTVGFQLPTASHVVIKLYNMVGREIRTLVDSFLEEGKHNFRWDGKNDHGNLLPSGIYGYIFKAGDFSDMRKMILLR